VDQCVRGPRIMTMWTCSRHPSPAWR
jgi:hypothetical protein